MIAKEELARLYVDNKMLASEIASLHGVSKQAVQRQIAKHGIILQNKKGRWMGEKSGPYKGGRTTARGYKCLTVQDHPAGKLNHGYIFEHRHVVEQHIGRYLKKGEQVHHLNFEKTDNNINNLVLFSSGSGHARFHKYMERVATFLTGLSNIDPTPMQFDELVLFRGEWVKSIDYRNWMSAS